jgi:hypothetical protein
MYLNLDSHNRVFKNDLAQEIPYIYAQLISEAKICSLAKDACAMITNPSHYASHK